EQWGQKAERVDFFDVKADVEALLLPARASFAKAVHPAFHPGRCAEISLDGKAIGVMGELHPRWTQEYGLPTAPVLFELDLAAVAARSAIKAEPVSKLQPVRRDLALVVDEEVTVAAMLDTFRQHACALVKEVALFDVYRGKGVEEGKKSLAFRV
ncbi:phenylalanine--tRNA ligase subunit beta, partial [Pseudomonas sp. MWU13-2860]